MDRQVVIRPTARIRGTLRVPGDKSIGHRYALLAAMAAGRTTLHNYPPGADCRSTLACLQALGVDIGHRAATAAGEPPPVTLGGLGLQGLQPATELDCGNSGSTMRMLAGVLAAHPFVSRLVGDPSLSRRPMGRIMGPLMRMGARIESAAGDRPPLTVHGAELQGIDYEAEVPSAQVKTAVLLAGLQATGHTRVTETTPTRDHTERALRAFGADLTCEGHTVTIDGGQGLVPLDGRIPGDISSAAFPAAAAAALAGSEVVIEGVGLNATRTAFLDALRRFGADVEPELVGEWQGEPVGRVRIRAQHLGALTIGGAEVAALIDELPVLAALATAGGEIHVTGAAELRVKESDRIAALVSGLRGLGADADELPDGFHVRGHRRLVGGHVDAHGDHRLAMAFAVAALAAAGPVTIDGADVVAVSYPTFFEDLERLGA
ncbi:MAG: 3-phosphoshikimate 1-carboxyvinyltransferase [Acidobacteriota bacterium]